MPVILQGMRKEGNHSPKKNSCLAVEGKDGEHIVLVDFLLTI